MDQEKKPTLKRVQAISQKVSLRQLLLAGWISVGVSVLLLVILNFIHQKNAKADPYASETMSSGSFIVNMGITPQTVANGLKPYGLIYDLITNYNVPVKWIIEPTKAKDGTDFTYNLVNYKGGPFIIPSQYISAAVAARITYWQSQGVQGVYTTSNIAVPVYLTITNFPLVMIDSLSGNQPIIMNYYTNAGIPSTAYTIGTPLSLNTCNDMWVNPHGDPTWATHSYLYNFVTVQKSYIWSQCHAVSNLEGCQNTSTPFQRLNYLTTQGLKCWKTTGTGPAYCGPSITETHVKDPSAPYLNFNPAEPVSQFMGGITGATQNGSEIWYQPQSTGQWRPTTKRIVTTGNGSSPKEGTLMVYGYAYGNSSNGMVMYIAGHDLAGSGTIPEQVAAQRSFLNYLFLAGKARQILFSSTTIPASFTGLQPQDVSVSVTSGTGPYAYQWTSSIPGSFVNPTAASTSFIPANTTSSGVITCTVTDACGRKNFFNQLIVVTASPLPVTLTSFSAQPVNNSVVLRWITSSEIKNDYFTVERSTNGTEFTEVGKINGAGTSTINNYYSYTDISPVTGISYYRLKQTDIDGTTETFSPVAVNMAKTTGLIKTILITPNPFANEFTAHFNSEKAMTVTVELITLRSKVVHSEKINVEAGENEFRASLGTDLESGVFVFRILDGGKLLGFAKAIRK